MLNKCEGEFCKETEELREYSVISEDGYDWGKFTYCDKCRDEDLSRGFEVKAI